MGRREVSAQQPGMEDWREMPSQGDRRPFNRLIISRLRGFSLWELEPDFKLGRATPSVSFGLS